MKRQQVVRLTYCIYRVLNRNSAIDKLAATEKCKSMCIWISAPKLEFV